MESQVTSTIGSRFVACTKLGFQNAIPASRMMLLIPHHWTEKGQTSSSLLKLCRLLDQFACGIDANAMDKWEPHSLAKV